jgi:hypothetical protein
VGYDGGGWCGRVVFSVIAGGGGVVCVGFGGGDECGCVCCILVGLGGAGRVGGMRRTSFISRSSKNSSRRSATTAVSLSKSIFTSVWVYFLHLTIIWSPLSSIFTSACIVFLCTSILFLLPRGDRCTFAVSGDRWVYSALTKDRRSYMSGATSIRRLSVVWVTLLNFDISITLLR